MHRRVINVGTVPFNRNMTSRAFESYFSRWEKKNLIQVFSHNKEPVKGHCGEFYQITDQRLLKKRWNKSIATGKIFKDKDLKEVWEDTTIEADNKLIEFLYKIGKYKSSLIYLGRKWLWKRKYWCTDEFNNWIENFNPECVFLSFSDDFFINEIAMYISEKFSIPIVSSIGDDYYFNYRFALSPFYHYYKLNYRKMIRKVFLTNKYSIYIVNKIRDKYN